MAKRKRMNTAPCPVARSVDIVGDRWSLLIVRDAFDGMRRFGEFQRSLDVARNILADRLRGLVDAGILATEPASDGTTYQEYVLTAKGQDLFTVIVGLRQWGERHLFERGENHSVLIRRDTGKPVGKLALTTRDGQALKAADTFVKKID